MAKRKSRTALANDVTRAVLRAAQAGASGDPARIRRANRQAGRASKALRAASSAATNPVAARKGPKTRAYDQTVQARRKRAGGGGRTVAARKRAGGGGQKAAGGKSTK